MSIQFLYELLFTIFHTVIIDAYPNTPQVSQGTTVVLMCHVAGVPSDTKVKYQWTCPNYECNESGLQSDGNITSRRQEGNIVVVDVVNVTDSGNYTCSVMNGETSLGSATYSIDSVNGKHCVLVSTYYNCLHFGVTLLY